MGTKIPVMRRDHYDADNDGVVDESGASPLSDDDPQALGTAGAGTGSAAARSDHIRAMPNRARGAYEKARKKARLDSASDRYGMFGHIKSAW